MAGCGRCKKTEPIITSNKREGNEMSEQDKKVRSSEATQC